MSTRRIGVLISSAGRRVQLIECFRDSAARLGIDLKIIATDVNPSFSAACHRADAYYSVPRCTDPAFCDAIPQICEREGVSLVVPTIDTELAIFAAQQPFLAQIGVHVAVSDAAAVAMARDKLLTAEQLKRNGIRTPRTIDLDAFILDTSEWSWPVIVKPRGGSSSVGIFEAREKADVVRQGLKTPYIVQERLVGKEYTVNMYVDHSGVMRCAIPHHRMETRSGEVSKGRTEDVSFLRAAAHQLAAAIPGLRGAVCFQAIVTDQDDYGIFELNARFGGGYPLAHKAGATFTQWLLEETLGMQCSACDTWRPGVVMLRYDGAVFSDV